MLELCKDSIRKEMNVIGDLPDHVELWIEERQEMTNV